MPDFPTLPPQSQFHTDNAHSVTPPRPSAAEAAHTQKALDSKDEPKAADSRQFTGRTVKAMLQASLGKSGRTSATGSNNWQRDLAIGICGKEESPELIDRMTQFLPGIRAIPAN